MSLDLEQIGTLFDREGHRRYGEAVDQRTHALQCAHLAESAGEPDEVVAAALLHDIAHLLASESDDGPPTIDDAHQFLAIPFLRGTFPEAVLEPIRLHVDAKRYLCAVDPCYFAKLSPASVASLKLQGGVLTREDALRFIGRPHAEAAVRLRRYDDRAKIAGMPTPPMGHFMHVLERTSR